MKRNIIIAGVLLPFLFVGFSQQCGAAEPQKLNTQVADTDAEKRILAVLSRMVTSHKTYLSVPIQDGKALRLLTEAKGAKNVVEIGTSTGYSGLWLCLALQRTNGRLTTFEIDHQRASMA
jgi:predicted O-methyltransferase YrrM